MDHTFYDVLLVNKTASLDEIKVAFKRRALQVHPDKGGSKEEFHLVYQALETLADPDARKRYDQSFGAKADLRKPKREKKSAAASVPKRKSPKQVPSKVPKGKVGVTPKFEAKESQKKPTFDQNPSVVDQAASRSTEERDCERLHTEAAPHSGEMDGRSSGYSNSTSTCS